MSEMSEKPTKEGMEKEIEEYIDNLVKEGGLRIGFEDVCGNLSSSTWIYKRMVCGYLITKYKFSDRVMTSPIFSVGEYNDIQYSIDESEELVTVIPSAPCFAVFCVVPKAETSKPINSLKTVLLGYEFPNCDHPNWIEEYKNLFINSLGIEEEESEDDESEEESEGEEFEEEEDEDKAETIEEFLKRCEEKDRKSGVNE